MGFGKNGLGAILRESRSQALGSMATDIGIFIGTKLAILKDFRMLKAELEAHIVGLAAGEGGGIHLYLADGDLSVAECQAAIVSDGPLGPNDIVGANVVERPVFLVATLLPLDNGATRGVFVGERGSPLVTFSNPWSFAETKSWNWLIMNRTGAAITDGASVFFTSKLFGVWIK